MRGVIGRPLSAMLVALLAAMGLPHAVVAEDGCPPEPPYGTYACVLDLSWDEPVKVAYGVGTEVNELSHLTPRVDSLKGDSAATEGGCGDPIEPILITRRIGATEPIEPWNQAELGVGTHSYECGSGADWAGMRPSDETPGEPWVYVIMATGTEPCEGHYTDTFDEWGNLLHRDQPEAATVYATVTCYHPGEDEPSETQHEVFGAVSVLNFAEWDKWRWSQYSDEPYPYRRPLPVVLGELTMPPISAGSDGEAVVRQLAPPLEAHIDPADGADAATADGRSAGSSPPRRKATRGGLFLLATFLILLNLAREAHSEHGRPMPPPEELLALSLLHVLTKTSPYEEAGQSPAARPVKPPGPSTSPPALKPKHERKGRVWVTPPATVKIKGASGKKVKLKAESWYQMAQGADGRREFYDDKGRLIGTSPPSDLDKVVVQTRDEWSDARDTHAAKAVEYVFGWFVEDPPPTVPLPDEPLAHTGWDDDAHLDDDEPFSPDLGPDGLPVYKPSWVSLKRAAPVDPNLNQKGDKTFWLEPPADGYLQGWYTRGGGFVLLDPEQGKLLGYIHADEQPDRFIRRHHPESPPNDS